MVQTRRSSDDVARYQIQRYIILAGAIFPHNSTWNLSRVSPLEEPRYARRCEKFSKIARKCEKVRDDARRCEKCEKMREGLREMREKKRANLCDDARNARNARNVCAGMREVARRCEEFN